MIPNGRVIMKKITIFVLMTLIFANFVDFGHANADSDSEAYGFFVDSDRYGTHKDLEIAEEYTIHNTKYGDYIIGYSRLVVLVYEDQTDSDWASRSEEHTSELQSRPHLVCRLLLEKKKKKTMQRNDLLT